MPALRHPAQTVSPVPVRSDRGYTRYGKLTAIVFGFVHPAAILDWPTRFLYKDTLEVSTERMSRLQLRTLRTVQTLSGEQLYLTNSAKSGLKTKE